MRETWVPMVGSIKSASKSCSIVHLLLCFAFEMASSTCIGIVRLFFFTFQIFVGQQTHRKMRLPTQLHLSSLRFWQFGTPGFLKDRFDFQGRRRNFDGTRCCDVVPLLIQVPSFKGLRSSYPIRRGEVFF